MCAIIINGSGCEKKSLEKILSDVENKTGILTLDLLATPEKITLYLNALKN